MYCTCTRTVQYTHSQIKYTLYFCLFRCTYPSARRVEYIRQRIEPSRTAPRRASPRAFRSIRALFVLELARPRCVLSVVTSTRLNPTRADATRRATRHCTARRRTNGRTHETRLVETRRDEKTPRALFSSALRLSLHVLDFPTPHQINITAKQHTLEEERAHFYEHIMRSKIHKCLLRVRVRVASPTSTRNCVA